MPTNLPACPSCGGVLQIREGHCENCDIQVRGHFGTSRYDALSPDQTIFLEAFLRCRGVIRDVEAALGLSYPTVKSRLESTLTTLGLQEHPLSAPAPKPEPEPIALSADRRRQILEAIQRGELTTEEGLRRMRG